MLIKAEILTNFCFSFCYLFFRLFQISATRFWSLIKSLISSHYSIYSFHCKPPFKHVFKRPPGYVQDRFENVSFLPR